MYYLQSRYYDPQICRFINADSTDYLGATGTLLSYNLFAYCENDAVNCVDPKGYAIETIIDVVSAGFSLRDFINKPSWMNFGFLVWDVASSFIPFAPGSYVAKSGKIVVRVANTTADFKKTKTLTFGTYSALTKLYRRIKGIQIHHVIEQRFEVLFKVKPNKFLCVPLDKELHKVITKRWRNVCKYGTKYKAIQKKRNETICESGLL